MRVLLKPDVARDIGVVLFKPGRELLSMFRHGRVLIEPAPSGMAHLPSGRVPDARQPLAEDKSLEAFFTDERVIAAAGGLSGLEFWLEHNVHSCQWPHSDYHHKELTTMRHPPGAMLLCWHCENELRQQTTERLSALARRNVIDWVIDAVRIRLRYNKEREISLAELCWWAVCAGAGSAITEEMAARSLLLPVEQFLPVYKESDIVTLGDGQQHSSA
ncbi:putative cytoplasmic protein [Trabulsiella guamensis ATCC 49490]|uniref:Putative cytoplasmic protein n=1 Tax=Trabulsiella guamensis ATCC 49490 TaxID=1005994 RepID=A0A085AA15_9ENTR|nr:putative cytoplasmic protein [Trabulsiella guamensis ATCC 49490]